MSDPTPESTAPHTPEPQAARPLWRRLAIPAAIFLILLVVARVIIGLFITPDALVKRIESQINARVQIESAELSLFRFPSEIRLIGVQISNRDELSNNAAKLSDRPPLERSYLSAKMIRLEGSPWALLSRKVDVDELIFEQAGVDIRLRKDGSLNIDKYFEVPAIVAGKPNPRKVVRPVVPPPVPPPGAIPGVGVRPVPLVPPVPERAQISVDDLGLATSVNHLLFTGAQVQAIIKRKDTLLDFRNLRFEITDLDVDPADLAAHNQGKIRISGGISVLQPEQGIQSATFTILGEGTLQPFDPATRLLNPLVKAKITFQTPSEINLLPSLGEIEEKLKALEKVGVKLGDELGKSVTFTDQTSVDIEYRDGLITILSALPAMARDHELQLDPGGFVHTGTSEHEFRVSLTASPALSKRVLEQLDEKAAIIPAGKSRDAFLAELKQSFFSNDRFRPVCTSTGQLDKPKVKLENELPDMDKFLKGLLEDLGIDPKIQKDLQESGAQLLEGILGGKDGE